MVTLVRHGETEWSRDRRHTGRTDLPLTAHGREQALLAGRRLAGIEFDLVLCSPLERAKETARLAALGDRCETLEDLAEWHYGAYEGRTTDEIRAERPGWDLWTDGCPDGESPADVAARADRVIERIEAAGGQVVLFGHGHQLRMLGARWIGLPPEAGGHLALGTSAICLLGRERERRAIRMWNGLSHLGVGSL